jgi:spore coat polysaccharide biosynthesis protein SpsF (cytidylyltransferase family)
LRVLIGIQARSGSTRLPRKAFEMISGRMMLDRVIEAGKFAAANLEKNGHKAIVAVLTPTNDPIVQEFRSRVEIVEGPEHDVLARYQVAAEKYDPELTVRITGDCPLIPAPLITYLTNLAINKGYDYISNADERFRTAIDGADCEVISRRLLDHTAELATRPHDREHVTPFIRRTPPEWARLGLAWNHFDLSGIKLSVDTQEDLERVRQAFETSFAKYQEAAKIYGKGAIHRL